MRGKRVGITPNTPEWLAWRAQGVTATDAAAILELSPWTSAYDLWWRKRADRDVLAAGGVLTDEFERSQRFEIGHALEPVLDRFFMDEGLPDGWRSGSGGCWQGKGEYAWLRATPDRMLYPNLITRTPCALNEFKTSASHSSFGEDDGTGLPDIPVQYRAQMIHQFLVTGVMRGWLTVLTPSMQIRHYEVIATDEECRVVYEAVHRFEQSLRDGDQPDLDGHEATTARLKEMWQDQTGETVEVDEDLAQWLWDADREHKQAKENLDNARNHVLAAIGDGKAAVLEDGRKVASRSVSHRKATDVPAVRDALASLARDFPFDPRALVAVSPTPTVALRVTPPKPSKATPIGGHEK